MVAEEACERGWQGISLRFSQFRKTGISAESSLLTLLGPMGFLDEDLRFPMALGWMAFVRNGQTQSLVP